MTYNWTFEYGGSQQRLTGSEPAFQFDIPGTYVVTMNVTDGTGQYATDEVVIDVRDTEDPVANAGGDVTIDQGTNLTLDASASTDNHPDFPGTGEFEWEIIGAEPKVVRLFGIEVWYVFAKPGEFVVRLTVTDPSGMNSNSTTIIVTVRDVEPPVADAGADQTVDEDQYAQFDGSNSTDNFDIAIWLWEFYLGDQLVNLTGKKVQYKFPAPGVYEIKLTVSDYGGQSHSDNFTITVVDVTPPVADAGDVREINEDIEVTLNGELSFDNVGIVSYEWSINGEVMKELEGVKPRYNFTEPGLYDITLKVTDAVGLSAEDTVQFHVLDVTPPHASAGTDIEIDEDVPHTFTGAGSSDNVGIETYEWIIESESEPRVRRQGESFEYVFAMPGIYTVTLTVTDPSGLWDSDTTKVTVLDVTAPIAVPPTSVTIKVGQTVQFDGRSSSDNVGIVNYTWEYELAGVPYEVSGANITQPFDSKGNYTVKLEVEDAAGNSDTATFYVLVKRPRTSDDGPGFGLLMALTAVGIAALLGGRSRRS
jgi:PGF-CTERM protein